MNRWLVCFKIFFRFGTIQEEGGGKPGDPGDPGDLVGCVSTRVLTRSDDGESDGCPSADEHKRTTVMNTECFRVKHPCWRLKAL